MEMNNQKKGIALTHTFKKTNAGHVMAKLCPLYKWLYV